MNNWSQTYFNTDGIVTADLTPDQHNANNRWFKTMLDQLTDKGQLYVPCLNRSFNKSGEEIDNSIARDQHYFTYKEDIV